MMTFSEIMTPRMFLILNDIHLVAVLKEPEVEESERQNTFLSPISNITINTKISNIIGRNITVINAFSNKIIIFNLTVITALCEKTS